MTSVERLGLCAILFIAQAWSNGGYSADPNNPDYGTPEVK